MNASAPIKACVIGYPVAHSRSPAIHNFWLRQYGVNGSYDAVAVLPDALENFFRNLKQNGYAGCNVTLPHKEDAAHMIDADPLAKKIGAANTVVVEGEKIRAFNTDIYGFAKNLESAGKAWQKKKPAYVIGAGGAARAVVVALIEAGAPRIYVTNRTPERLKRFGEELGKAFNYPLHLVGWEDRTDPLPGVDLLVNTTSQGMEGQPPLDLDIRSLKSGALVTDLIYTPLETTLLGKARARNHPIVDGLGMLLHQAAPGFEAWFGVKPEVTPELRAAVIADIQHGKAA
jgi:shikimate dehydrogenase